MGKDKGLTPGFNLLNPPGLLGRPSIAHGAPVEVTHLRASPTLQRLFKIHLGSECLVLINLEGDGGHVSAGVADVREVIPFGNPPHVRRGVPVRQIP